MASRVVEGTGLAGDDADDGVADPTLVGVVPHATPTTAPENSKR